MKRPAVPLARLAWMLVPVLLFSGEVLARAGGGQDFGGSGGGGGSSGFGGGDGFGYLLVWLLQLVFRYPLIGIPLLVFAVIIATKVHKGARTNTQFRTIEKAGRMAVERRQADLDQRLAALVSRDPAFTTGGFLQKVNKGFIEVQAAWSGQDLSRVTRFVSDGIRERFSMQTEMMRKEGFRNTIENARVLSSSIVAVESDSVFDTIHVEIRAQGTDRDVDTSTGRVLRDRGSEPFTEFWSFLRRPGATTLANGGLLEGICPNCGAPLEVSDSGTCENCDSVVTSGEYDWVLAEITQSVEWGTTSDPSIIPGYGAMVERDPAFNLQHVEDRVSVIFWRFIRSHFEGSSEALRKVALPSFIPGFDENRRFSTEDGWWLYFMEAAVGAVEIQRIEPASAGSGERDRIEVLIRWSARNARRNAEGKTRSAGDRTIRPVVYHLVRNSEVKTQREKSFLSSHCQACGAPYTADESGNCEYCGRVLNDGGQDWVLASIGRFEASRITPQAVNPISRASLVPPDLILASMAAVMFADGRIDPGEEALLRSFAGSRGIPAGTVDEITASVRAGERTLPVPADSGQTRDLIAAMARMVMADGRMSTEEIEMLAGFGESSGMTRADVMVLLAGQRAELYAEAKKALK